MAEIISAMHERLLPEYEQLRRYDICTDEQIRECIRRREQFQAKITQSKRSMQDFGDFIIFEKKIHKWVIEKEKIHGSKLSSLKSSIANRIIRLYRDGLRAFPHEERFWDNYIKFCKKTIPHEVSGIYEKMLLFHGDIPGVWCDAALWAYEYSLNMSRVKDIFFRGLQRHPVSEAINKTFFDILLMEAYKMSPERILAGNTISEQDIGLERVEVIYKNSKKKITNVRYFLSLLERCEEEKFAIMTAPLQRLILGDLLLMFPLEEVLWDSLAQRELRGFSMSDLRRYQKPTSISQCEEPNKINEVTAEIEKSHNELLKSEGKQPYTDGKINKRCVWLKRTLKRRIELSCAVYQMAVRTLATQEMWIYYVNAMLKLNQDMSTQQILKRKRLAIAFKECHISGFMIVDHYCIFIRMLLQTPKGIRIAESVLQEAVKYHKSVKLYEMWVSTYIVENNEPKVFETFRRAISECGAESFPVWKLVIQYYKTRYDDCTKRLNAIYKEACEQSSPEFAVFRAEFLDFCALNMTMKQTRAQYDELCKVPPPSLELHQKMAMLEAQVVMKTPHDFDRWRLCHENAVLYFGKTHSKVWIDFIKFERDHGDPKRMTFIYDRAKHALDSKLVDNFISEYTLLTAII